MKFNHVPHSMNLNDIMIHVYLHEFVCCMLKSAHSEKAIIFTMMSEMLFEPLSLQPDQQSSFGIIYAVHISF